VLPVESFNGTWTVLVLVLAAAGVGAHYLLRHRSLDSRTRWIVGLGVATFVSSLIFHIAFLVNPPAQGWPLFQNLPLHLCSILSWLMPLTTYYDWKPLRSVAFFPGAIAGMLTLVSATPAEQGHPLIDFRTFFWVAHALNAIVPFLMVSLGLFRPQLRQVIGSVGWLAVGALGGILPITLALRAWVDPGANYFYLFSPEGADILQVVWDVIPIPILYLVPIVIVVIPVLYLMYWIYRVLSRGRQPSPLPQPAA
jgi:uncharacterized membrane protein YwaF